jgi:hypothetical protein
MREYTLEQSREQRREQTREHTREQRRGKYTFVYLAGVCRGHSQSCEPRLNLLDIPALNYVASEWP